MVIETKVSQQHGARKQQSGWVSLVLALDIKTDMSASGFEDSDITTHVAARDNTRPTDQSSSNVGKDTTVKVGHDHDVELLRPGDSLHRSVVDDHVVDFQGRVVLTDLLDRISEETICEFHNVGLVNAGDLLSVVGEGERKGELGDTFRLGPGDDLQRLDDTVDRLMLKARVLTFGVLTHNAEIDIVVPCLQTWNVLDQNHRGVNVELLTEGHVERLVTGPLDRCVQNTLQAELVSLEGSY